MARMGRGGFEAYAADDHSLGLFPSPREAAAAIIMARPWVARTTATELAQGESNILLSTLIHSACTRWEGAFYEALGGLFVVLTALTAGFFINRRKQSISNDPTSFYYHERAVAHDPVAGSGNLR
jgi:hypothetical protein